ncbi:MAG: XdhC family protein [Pyrinomonadaceae bacterium]
MNKELEIWQFAARKLKRDEALLLLVVAESSGSSPGRQGFKMIVARNEMRGSIGGGVMEVNLVQSAKCKVQNNENKPELVEQVHRKNSEDASGMICSGKQTVIFLELNSRHLKTVEKIIFTLIYNQTRKLQISNIGLRVLENIENNSGFYFAETRENEFVYEELLGCKNKLFIIGGGHCALALSELMSGMDFHISLFDDREDLNTLAKNEFVHEKHILDSYEKIADFIESGADIYVVVMTLGFVFDEIVIRQLFKKNFKYFGVLGSKAKMKTLLRNLEKEGLCKERLKKIRAPIGLKINSRTPEEIAVSIAAEIIAVKNAVLS